MMKEVLPGNCRGVRVKRQVNHADARRGHRHYYNAFTLIELVVVFGLILVLTGLVLSTVGYARKKGARARAETEIAAMAAACENYKSDNATYPFSSDTNGLDARSNFDPSTYWNSSLFLYEKLMGVTTGNRSEVPSGRTYMTFKPSQLGPADQSQAVQFIRDPFGNSYGYSTAGNPQANPTPTGTPGFNPTFDLWSTASYTGQISPTPTPSPQNFWVKNW